MPLRQPEVWVQGERCLQLAPGDALTPEGVRLGAGVSSVAAAFMRAELSCCPWHPPGMKETRIYRAPEALWVILYRDFLWELITFPTKENEGKLK